MFDGEMEVGRETSMYLVGSGAILADLKLQLW